CGCPWPPVRARARPAPPPALSPACAPPTRPKRVRARVPPACTPDPKRPLMREADGADLGDFDLVDIPGPDGGDVRGRPVLEPQSLDLARRRLTMKLVPIKAHIGHVCPERRRAAAHAVRPTIVDPHVD